MPVKDSYAYSFVISTLLAPRYYKQFQITKDIPFTERPLCPCDQKELKTLCTLIAHGDTKRIRIGCCESCGHVTYIDKPEEKWIHDYYSNIWDIANRRKGDFDAEIERLKSQPGRFSSMKIPLDQFKALNLDKNRSVLEIGAGVDLVAKGLKENGFKNIVTVDASERRAKITQKAFGFETVAHPFESTEAQKELKKFAPFGLIFSGHVLEHMYDPDKVIKYCAELQRPGDHLILNVPNVTKEATGFIIFFLPHLHSFSIDSLGTLLHRHGYDIVDQRLDPLRQNLVIAKKVKYRTEYISKIGPICWYEQILKKMVKDIGIGYQYKPKYRLMWWFRSGGTGQERLWSRLSPIVLLQYYFYSKFYFKRKYRKHFEERLGERFNKTNLAHVSSIMGCVVHDIKERFTSFKDSPIEIQYDDSIALWYK